MRHLMMSLAFAISAGVLVASCGDDDPPPEPESCPCACTAVDPVAHCVRTQSCDSTADCPTGTVCAELRSGQSFPVAEGNDPLAACGSSTPGKRCQLPAGRMGRHLLNTGFEVPAFGLFRLQSTSLAAFTWNPPVDTHAVHCALFACPPVVSETVRDDRPFYQIENFEECVLAAKVYEPGEGVFDLGDASLAFDPDDAPPDCGTASPRVVHELMAGCWAYDTSQIIAASPLEPVSPSETFNYNDQFDLVCTSEATGRTCARDGSALGICRGGVCRAPCVTQRDCNAVSDPPDTDGGAPDAGDGASFVCVKEGGYVGACMPEDQMAIGGTR